jgi:hypothetical protein
VKLISKTGKFNPDGEIILRPGISIPWKWLSHVNISELPQGTPLCIEISFDENILLSGQDGIVWATFDIRQAEVLFNALLAQNIGTVIRKIEFDDNILLLLKTDNDSDTGEAMDYIWRKEGGLRLKPDWIYPEGEPNKSYEKWVNG